MSDMTRTLPFRLPLRYDVFMIASELRHGDVFEWLGVVVRIIDVRPSRKGMRLFQVATPVGTTFTVEIPEDYEL